MNWNKLAFWRRGSVADADTPLLPSRDELVRVSAEATLVGRYPTQSGGGTFWRAALDGDTLAAALGGGFCSSLVVGLMCTIFTGCVAEAACSPVMANAVVNTLAPWFFGGGAALPSGWMLSSWLRRRRDLRVRLRREEAVRLANPAVYYKLAKEHVSTALGQLTEKKLSGTQARAEELSAILDEVPWHADCTDPSCVTCADLAWVAQALAGECVRMEEIKEERDAFLSRLNTTCAEFAREESKEIAQAEAEQKLLLDVRRELA